MKKWLALAACLTVAGGVTPRTLAQPGPRGGPRPPLWVPPPGPPAVNPPDRRKDLDPAYLSSLHYVPHALPHGYHPAPEAFRAAPPAEAAAGGGWARAFRAGGRRFGGIGAGVGAGIAGLFGALFGRRKGGGQT